MYKLKIFILTHFQKYFAIWKFKKHMYLSKRWCMMHVYFALKEQSFLFFFDSSRISFWKIILIIYVNNFLMKNKVFCIYFINSFKLQCFWKWIYIYIYIYIYILVIVKNSSPPLTVGRQSANCRPTVRQSEMNNKVSIGHSFYCPCSTLQGFVAVVKNCLWAWTRIGINRNMHGFP